MYLVNGFAPVIGDVEFLKYLSLFHYYEGSDPLTAGVDLGGIAVLLAVTAVLAAVAKLGFDRRDLRG